MSGKSDLEDRLGEYAEMIDASRLIKPSGRRGLLSPDVIYRFRRSGAWLVQADTDDADKAIEIGKRVRKNLVSKRALMAADPFFHDKTLYVEYGDNTIDLGVEEKPVRVASAPNKSDERSRILDKGRAVFGANGVKITGHEGAYTLAVIPALAKFRRVFSTTTTHAATLAELEARLDKVIATVSAL